MKKRVRKGVIAVAGQGTRFLPATKSMPKEMLPIIDKPIIQYIVEEMVEAGIEQIIFVTSASKRALEDHFDRNVELEYHLLAQNKHERLEAISKLATMASFVYIRQKGPYGNGTPCLNVRDIVGDEPFVYAYGDDLVKAKVSFTKQLIDQYSQTDAVCVLGAQEVPLSEVHKYGVYKIKDGSEEMQVESMVEKPSPDMAPSRLAAFGRFVLDPEVFDILGQLELGKDNELWMTDAIDRLIKKGRKVTLRTVHEGTWLTTGDPLAFLKTTVEYLKDRTDLAEDFKKYLFESNFLS